MRISSLAATRLTAVLTFSLTVLLTGCSLVPTALPTASPGAALRGNLHGGQQPIVGARVYLLAAGTAGYGSASASLLTSGTDGSDSIGGYVLSASDGGFTIGGDYTCTPDTQVYFYALGGNPGAGVNSASGLLAALGNCPNSGDFATAVPFVWIDEVSTVAAAYAFSAFATDATDVGSSGSALAQTGIANAFANAANLADISSGTALTTTPGGNGTVPQSEINTLANILASCVNSTGPASSSCATLFTNAKANGSSGATATDTATAAINIAHNSATNVHNLYTIPTLTAAFGPALSSEPADFTITLAFTGAGIAAPNHLAIDAGGNVWIGDTSPSLDKLSPLGAAISSSSGYALAGTPGDLAIDPSGNVWVTDPNNGSLVEYSNSGGLLNTNTPSSPALGAAAGISFDPTGNLWVLSQNANQVTQFTSGGIVLNTFVGAGLNQPAGIASDHAGNIWIGNTNATSVSELTNAGSPSGSTPFTGDSISPGFGPRTVAIDSSANLWAQNQDSSISGLDSSGAALSGPPYNAGNNGHADGLAIDGQNNLWTLSDVHVMFSPDVPTLFGFSSTGTALLGATGHVLPSTPSALALDGSGNLWYALSGSVNELVGAAAPVVTPIAAAVSANTLGTRP